MTVTDTFYVSVQGFELYVSRSSLVGGGFCTGDPVPGQPPPCTCPDGPCWHWGAGEYLLSGSQTITATRIDDHLRLTASPSSGLVGTQVTFTASTDDGSAFTMQNWQWVKDDAAAADSTRTCAWSATSCTTKVYTSGTVSVMAKVNGVMRKASAHISIIAKCPTNDPNLDDDAVRDSLVAMLHRSGYPDQAVNNRRETGGYFLRDRLTGQVTFHSAPDDPNATPCNTEVSIQYDASQYDLAGEVHTHPYHLLEPTASCPGYQPGPYAPLPSDADMRTLKDFNTQLASMNRPEIPGYFIDGNVVERYDENGPVTTTQYIGGQCPWSQQP